MLGIGNSIGRLLGTLTIVAAGLLAAVPSFAADVPEAGGSGRVSAIEGVVYGRGPYDTDSSELAKNAVLRPGDEVFTDEGTFAEVELPEGTFLRLAGNTSIVINKIDDDGIEIALSQGAAYLSRGVQAPPARFSTFAGSVDLGGRSMVRVANDPNKSALEISVADGSAELRTDRETMQVQPRQTLSVTAGRGTPSAFDVERGDAFDRWNREREQRVRGTGQQEHVAANVVGSYELEGNGTWVSVDGHWAWKPTVVEVGWRPYSNGYWAWTEPYGWTWVDYAAWGYSTSHYGRWYFRGGHGWVWYPDAVWGAAWVVWAAFDGAIGWAPCDFWGRPIYVSSYRSYYDWGAWNYCDGGYFYTGGGYHYYGDYYGHPRTDRGTTATARHEATRTAGSQRLSSRSIGAGGKFAIHKFDQETIRKFTPVPVRDPARELTPKHIVAAADSGRLRGVAAENRRGDIVSRAATGGGVKPEPWNRGVTGPGARGNGQPVRDSSRSNPEIKGNGADNLGGARSRGNDDATTGERMKTQGWSGRTPVGGERTSEGWAPRGSVAPERARTTEPGSEPKGPASRYEGAGSSSYRGGATSPGSTNDGGANVPASRYEPSRSEPSRSEPSRSEPSRFEPSRSEPSRSEPTRSAPSRSEPSRPAPSSAPAAPTRSAPAPSAPARTAPAPSHDSTPAPSSGKKKHSLLRSPAADRPVVSSFSRPAAARTNDAGSRSTSNAAAYSVGGSRPSTKSGNTHPATKAPSSSSRSTTAHSTSARSTATRSTSAHSSGHHASRK